MRLITFLLVFISPSVFAEPATEETVHQLSEFITISIVLFSFMLGAQFGHTR